MKILSLTILAVSFALSIVSAMLPPVPPTADFTPRKSAFVSTAVDPQRAALADVGGCCSGVYVTPDTVLTARHCLRAQTIQVDCHPAQILHVSREADVAVLRVTGGEPDHAWLPVARQPPAPGEPVVSLGYPAGQFARMEGRVKSVGPVQFGLWPISRQELLLSTTHRVLPGNSGGPLLDARGAVVGIASRASTDDAPRPESLWVPTQSIRVALTAAGVQLVSTEKPILYVFIGSKCPACRRFEADLANPQTGLRQQLTAMFDVQVINLDQRPDQVQQWGLTSKPAFRCPNWSQNLYGYKNQADFLAMLAPELSQAYERPRPLQSDAASDTPLPNPAAAAAPALPALVPPPTAPAPIAAPPIEERDLSGVTVLILVKRREIPGGTIGKHVASALERLIEGPLRRRLQEQLGDTVDVQLVFQRLHPERYDALTDVAGLDGDVGLVVLVKKSNAGIAKGFLIAQIESAAKSAKDGRLSNLPVEILFERINSDDYDAAESALTLPEGTPPDAIPPGDSPPWLLWLIGALSAIEGLVESWIGGRSERTVRPGRVPGSAPDRHPLGG